MAVTLYPALYGHGVYTFDQMMREIREHGEPEFVRRLEVWLLDQHGTMGIGDAWRATGTQPNRPGFAPEGQSFHQTQRFRDGLLKCMAVDLVVIRPGGPHRPPYWKEVPKKDSALARRYGLHCNISTETWHMQAIEVNGWSSWVNAGRHRPVAGYKIPTPATPPPATPDPAPGPDTPPGSPSMRKGATDANTVVAGWPAGRVSTLQKILGDITVDGQFGPQTDTRLRDTQFKGGIAVDGVYGPQTSAKFVEWRGH